MSAPGRGADTELPIAVADEVFSAIEAGTLDLPLLPEVAQRVLGIATRDEVDLQEIVSVLERDPSMAAHVLGVSNSPAYAPRSPIVTLQQAVSRLGAKQIRDIALVVTCRSRVFDVKGFESEVRALFRHSVAAGAFARTVARRIRSNVEEAFLAALLHDVGRPVLLQAIADEARRQRTTAPRDGTLAFSGQHHARVGQDLGRQWKLSSRTCSAIACHHDPLSAGDARTLALVVGLADELASAWAGEVDVEVIRKHTALEPLNLYVDDVDQLLAASDDVTALVEAMT